MEPRFAAGTSYGRERFYYLLDSIPQYVTECQDSEVAYPHHVETTGWQNHDDQLFAYRLTTVYIEGTPKGRYNIKTSEVLPGEPQTAYVYDGQGPKANGDIWYEDCTRFEGRDLVNTYKRPDGTTYGLKVDEATPANLGNVCSATVQWADPTHSSWTAPQNHTGGPCGNATGTVTVRVGGSDGYNENRTVYNSNHCNYSAAVGTRTTVREDGETIGEPSSKTCTTLSAQSSIHQKRSGNDYWTLYEPNKYNYPAHTDSIKSGCMGSWGWW